MKKSTFPTVTIIGANGTMGSQCAGIIAGFGNSKIFMVARNLKKAKLGIIAACDSIKSDSINHLLIPKTYKNLRDCISRSDWIFELAGEDIDLKKQLNVLVSKYRRSNSIVSSVTSGLAISQLSQVFDADGQRNYFGTHFYNPPYKMLLCELISNPNSSNKTKTKLSRYLSNTLRRVVVDTNDTPGFAGNRIGFQFINEAVWFAHKYESRGGIAYIDELLGGIIGHAMPPLATTDLVGLDVHQAIICNLYKNSNDSARDTFKTPPYLAHLISLNRLGNKSKGGFYKIENGQKMVFNTHNLTYQPIPKFSFKLATELKNSISVGLYSDAFNLILSSSSVEANIIQYFLARYISYSYSLIGSVVVTKEDIDLVMGFGFNWLPPSALIDLLGGKDIAIQLIRQFNFTVPDIIIKQPKNTPFYTLQSRLDYRSFIRTS